MFDKKKYMKEYRAKNADKIREKNREYNIKWRRENPEKVRESCDKWRAKMGGRVTVHDNYYFGGNRAIAIARDGYRCVECGMTNDEHLEIFSRELNVHHIDNKGRNNEEKNHDVDNLMTLCVKCHSRLHRPIDKRWIKERI